MIDKQNLQTAPFILNQEMEQPSPLASKPLTQTKYYEGDPLCDAPQDKSFGNKRAVTVILGVERSQGRLRRVVQQSNEIQSQRKELAPYVA
jgi:hypothetical protein